MKKFNAIVVVGTICLMGLIGCQNALVPGGGASEGCEIPAGMGLFFLDVDNAGNQGRTIRPDIDVQYLFDVYRMVFAATGGGAVSLTVDRERDDLTDPVALVPGTYTLTVYAYDSVEHRASNPHQPVARGQISITIGAGVSITQAVPLMPVVDGAYLVGGTFRWDVTFPSGIDEFEMDITGFSTNVSVEDFPRTFTGGSASGSVSLDAGFYSVIFTLTRDNITRPLVWREILHIYNTMTSSFDHEFSDEHFTRASFHVIFHDGNGVPIPEGSATYFFDAFVPIGDPAVSPYAPPAPGARTTGLQAWFGFDGWYTDRNGAGTRWNANANLTNDLIAAGTRNTINLYANWTLESMLGFTSSGFNTNDLVNVPGARSGWWLDTVPGTWRWGEMIEAEGGMLTPPPFAQTFTWSAIGGTGFSGDLPGGLGTVTAGTTAVGDVNTAALQFPGNNGWTVHENETAIENLGLRPRLLARPNAAANDSARYRLFSARTADHNGEPFLTQRRRIAPALAGTAPTEATTAGGGTGIRFNVDLVVPNRGYTLFVESRFNAVNTAVTDSSGVAGELFHIDYQNPRDWRGPFSAVPAIPTTGTGGLANNNTTATNAAAAAAINGVIDRFVALFNHSFELAGGARLIASEYHITMSEGISNTTVATAIDTALNRLINGHPGSGGRGVNQVLAAQGHAQITLVTITQPTNASNANVRNAIIGGFTTLGERIYSSVGGTTLHPSAGMVVLTGWGAFTPSRTLTIEIDVGTTHYLEYRSEFYSFPHPVFQREDGIFYWREAPQNFWNLPGIAPDIFPQSWEPPEDQADGVPGTIRISRPPRAGDTEANWQDDVNGPHSRGSQINSEHYMTIGPFSLVHDGVEVGSFEIGITAHTDSGPPNFSLNAVTPQVTFTLDSAFAPFVDTITASYVGFPETFTATGTGNTRVIGLPSQPPTGRQLAVGITLRQP